MSGLTDKMIELNKRVGALETSSLDENASIARITKIYGNIRISAVITARTHTYPVCDTAVLCSTTLII